MKKLAYLLLCFALTSCSTVKSGLQSKVKPSEILFFKLKPPKKGTMQAYTLLPFQGHLALRENCLYLKKIQNKKVILFGIIWPWDYSLKIKGKSVTIVNGSNKPIARIGDKLGLTGGYTSKNNFMSKYSACTSYKVKSIFIGHPNL